MILGAIALVFLLLSLFLFFLVMKYQKRCELLEKHQQETERELEHLEKSFTRFAPTSLVERFIDQGVSISAEKRDVTVLFADLKNFTRLSAGLDPEVLVEILNGYFSKMCEAIKLHHGHVSKFIGDGIMATFGALTTNPWQAGDAVMAALAMRAALSRYNGELQAKGLAKLAFGVGIHHGTVVAGVMGSEELLEYTVIGDVVNTASRVESLTRELKTDILITDDVKNMLDEGFKLRPMTPAHVKGKAAAIKTFAIEPVPNDKRGGSRAQQNCF